METLKKYCLIIKEKDKDNYIEIEKNYISELTEIVNCLDFEKVRSARIFRSDNL